MEKRIILAIGLSILVLLGWGKLFPPPERQAVPPVQVDTQSPAQVEDTRTERPLPEVADVPLPEPDEPVAEVVAAETSQEIRITNDLYEAVLTNRGAGLLSWKLRQFRTAEGDPLELLPSFNEQQRLPLFIDTDDRRLTDDLNAALYRVERSDMSSGVERIAFSWADGRGIEVRKVLTFHPDTYLVDIELEVRDRGRIIDARLTVGPGFGAQEARKGRSNYYYDGQAVWNVSGEVSRTKRSKLDGSGGFSGELLWAGLEDQYFTALILPASRRAVVSWEEILQTRVPVPDADEPEEMIEPIIAVAIPEGLGQLYIGPKQYKPLKELGSELEGVVWFSSKAWLAWIVRHIYLGLLWIHDTIVPNYGMAIILATFLLRLVLFPVNQFAMVSMKRSQLQMQRIQPKVKALKNKYKKNKDAQSRAKMNQEMMELYKVEGINPMGGVTGCVPLLAQFPILIGFYNMLTVAIELRGAPFFGWIHDLTVKDPYWITPVLMGVTMFVQQRLSMSKIKDPQQLQQQKIMMFMPFMFTFICLQMPAGLVLYWFMNNLLGIGQQWLVNKKTVLLEKGHLQKVKT
jgi:YidC/Oxa1 family membrane protein insertase